MAPHFYYVTLHKAGDFGVGNTTHDVKILFIECFK